MFTDIHSHIIYGVDDGAHARESMYEMLHSAVRDNIDRIITTPHMTPGQEEFHMSRYLRHIDYAREYCEKNALPLTIYTGAEILYTQETPSMLREKRVPTLADSRFVLLEFSPDDPYSHIREALRKIAGLGLVPVVAHVERYNAIRREEMLAELKETCNARFQVNAHTVVDKQGFFQRRWIKKLLDSDYIDFLATDTHHMPSRSTCMQDCFDIYSEMYSEEDALKLMRDNPAKILEDK